MGSSWQSLCLQRGVPGGLEARLRAASVVTPEESPRTAFVLYSPILGAILTAPGAPPRDTVLGACPGFFPGGTTTCGSRGCIETPQPHARPPPGQTLSFKFLRFRLQPLAGFCLEDPGLLLRQAKRGLHPRDLSAALDPHHPGRDFPVRPSPGPLGPQPRGQVLGPKALGRDGSRAAFLVPRNRLRRRAPTSPQASGPAHS